MPHKTELADRIRAAGLTVVEVDGWKTRGSSSFNPGGVVAHHTADGSGEIPSLRVLIHGRSDLPGPLCQVGLARSGACYVIAAGRANHAGRGGWKGLVGNSSVWGIEAENKGGPADPWPTKQLDAYYTLCAVLLDYSAHPDDESYVCGHKEWAPGRKVDPHTLNMNTFREQVEEEDMAAIDYDKVRKIIKEELENLEHLRIQVKVNGQNKPLGIDYVIKELGRKAGVIGPNNEWTP